MSLFFPNITPKQFENGSPIMSYFTLQMQNIITNNFHLSVMMRYRESPMSNIDRICRNIRIIMDRKMQC
jgi:hypothetical protein